MKEDLTWSRRSVQSQDAVMSSSHQGSKRQSKKMVDDKQSQRAAWKSEQSQTKLKLGTKEHENISIEHTKDKLQWSYQLGYFIAQRSKIGSIVGVGNRLKKAINWDLKIESRQGWSQIKAYRGGKQGVKYGDQWTHKLEEIPISRIQQIWVVGRQSWCL